MASWSRSTKMASEAEASGGARGRATPPARHRVRRARRALRSSRPAHPSAARCRPSAWTARPSPAPWPLTSRRSPSSASSEIADVFLRRRRPPTSTHDSAYHASCAHHGRARAIGLACAQKFAASGYSVCIHFNTSAKEAEAAAAALAGRESTARRRPTSASAARPQNSSPMPLRSSEAAWMCASRITGLRGDSVRDDLGRRICVELRAAAPDQPGGAGGARARCGDAHEGARRRRHRLRLLARRSPRRAARAGLRRLKSGLELAHSARWRRRSARAEFASPPSRPASSTRRWRRRCSLASAATAFASSRR